MNPFFITSTGTDIGKTLVTTGLCWQLRQQKKKVTALKPVVSGFDAQDEHSDPALILKSCGLTPTLKLMETIAPWRFSAPLAPSMAAEKEHKTLRLEDVTKFCRDHETLETDALLVEGAGGVMAPLARQHTALDLMAALNWPVILVAGNYLGAISHTLTALEALRARGLQLAALVLSESEKSAATLGDTAAALAEFVSSDISIVKIPRLAVQREQWKHLPPISWICTL